MRTIKTEKNTYVFYDSAKEIPIKRWNDFITKSIQSSQLGLDFSSCAQKLSQMDEYLQKGDREGFNNSRINLQMQLFLLYMGRDIKLDSLSHLIHKIGEDIVQQEQLPEVHKILEEDSEVTLGLVEELLESIRKK